MAANDDSSTQPGVAKFRDGDSSKSWKWPCLCLANPSCSNKKPGCDPAQLPARRHPRPSVSRTFVALIILHRHRSWKSSPRRASQRFPYATARQPSSLPCCIAATRTWREAGKINWASHPKCSTKTAQFIFLTIRRTLPPSRTTDAAVRHIGGRPPEPLFSSQGSGSFYSSWSCMFGGIPRLSCLPQNHGSNQDLPLGFPTA